MTGQSADSFIENGQKLTLLANPLCPFLDQIDWRPSKALFSTGNYRRYVAQWEIIDKHLWLIGLGALVDRSAEEVAAEGGKRHRLVRFDDIFTSSHEEAGLFATAPNPAFSLPAEEIDLSNHHDIHEPFKKVWTPRPLSRRVRADWFTGRLRVGYGEQEWTAHHGYECVFEKDQFISIKNGRVTRRRWVEGYSPFAERMARIERAEARARERQKDAR